MSTTLEPVMTAISVPGWISGSAIIDDLLHRIREKLESNCDLRATDCYRSYSAKVFVELQLTDIDTVTVGAEVHVGAFDPALKVERIALAGEVEAAGDVNLEKPVEPPSEPQRDAGGRFLKRAG